MLVGIHRRRAEATAAALTTERDEREAAIATATREEQARIAVDLHDVVSHGLSVVIVQTVADTAGGLDVVVENSGGNGTSAAAPGAGRGLIGIHQRARVSDGTVTAEPTADGGFRVHLVLPIGRA